MIDPGSILAAWNSAKAAYGMAKGISELTSDVKVNTAVTELLGHLIDTQQLVLSAQQDMQQIIDAKAKVERELAEYREWDIEKSRYQLHQPYRGTSVYKLKEGLQPNEPEHYLCPDCFHKKQKRILQGDGAFQHCNECDTSYQFQHIQQTSYGGY